MFESPRQPAFNVESVSPPPQEAAAFKTYNFRRVTQWSARTLSESERIWLDEWNIYYLIRPELAERKRGGFTAE